MRHRLSLFVIALMTATTVVMGAVILSHTPVQAQFGPNPEQVAQQVYETLPDFPRENQYLHRKKKQVAESNTLVSRLILYHKAKGRSPQFRLDWKLTLADYLGLNDYISPRDYAGTRLLKENPFEGDQAVIQNLDREGRNALIQAIVDTYVASEPVQQPAAQPAPAPTTSKPVAPASNNATDLLAP